MPKTAQFLFKSSQGKTKILNIANPKEGLDEATARQAMEKIAATKAFQVDDVEIYQTPYSAKYVERSEEQIFTTKK